jgi:hypothetical protein
MNKWIIRWEERIKKHKKVFANRVGRCGLVGSDLFWVQKKTSNQHFHHQHRLKSITKLIDTEKILSGLCNFIFFVSFSRTSRSRFLLGPWGNAEDRTTFSKATPARADMLQWLFELKFLLFPNYCRFFVTKKTIFSSSLDVIYWVIEHSVEPRRRHRHTHAHMHWLVPPHDKRDDDYYSWIK